MKFRNLFFSFFFCFVLVSNFFVFIPSVNAVDYSNWIENSSFEIKSNYLVGGNAETGGVFIENDYGVWIGNSTEMFVTDNYYSPLTSFYFSVSESDNNWLIFNFTDSLLVSEIDSFYGYVDNNYYLHKMHLRIFYSDDSYDDEIFCESDTDGYIYVDFLEFCDITKSIDAIKWYRSGGVGGNKAYLDDLTLIVDDGRGQDIIDLETSPWYTLATVQNNFGYINTVNGRLDNTSVQFSGISLSQGLGQDINFLKTDYVFYIDTYVYGADVASGSGIKCVVLYSDRTTDSRTKYVTGDGSSWEYINFGSSWIDSDKYIVAVWFLQTVSETAILLDDFGLWATVPLDFSRFSFDVSPQPISIGSYEFEAYSNTLYTMNCYFYNITNDELNENGTYQISDSFGIREGSMVNGYFSFQLSERNYQVSPYTLETLSITVFSSTETFNIEISIYWYPTVTGGIGDIDNNVDADFMTNWIIIAIILLMPSLIFAFIGSQINPSMGMISFVGGLTLMGAISLRIGLINIWFMFAILIVDILIILGMLKGGSNNG